MISVFKDLSGESENQSINQSVYVSCLVGLAMGEINSKPTDVSTKHNVSQSCVQPLQLTMYSHVKSAVHQGLYV